MQFGEGGDDRLAERRDETARDGGGGLHRDLLAENRPQAQLEPVERAGHAQAGIALYRLSQARVASQLLRNHVGARVEVEQRADPAQERGEHRRQAVGKLQHQRVLLARLRHANPALRVSQRDGAGIRIQRDPLDPGERASGEKGEDAGPVVGRPIGKLQRGGGAVADGLGPFGGFPAQPRRRHAIAAAERVVEAAQAVEATRQSDLRNRQPRVGQQLLGEQQAAGQQQLDWRHAELLLHDAANLARAQLKLIGDCFEAAFRIELALLEPLHDQLRDALGIVDRRAAGGELRPAAQARAKSGLLGFLRRLEEPAVGLLRRLHRADRPAVDARRGDPDEEDAVEPRIARRERFVEPASVEIHSITVWPVPAIFGHDSGLHHDVRNWPAVRCLAAYRQVMTKKRHVYKLMSSPVGQLTLVATDDGLAAILWENDRPGRVRLDLAAEDHGHPVLVEAERQLHEYFGGQRQAFALKLDVAGTRCRSWRRATASSAPPAS